MDEDVWHYLTASQRTTVPRRHIFLATDAREQRERGVYAQTWRAGVAVYRSAPKGRKVKEHVRGYDTPDALWTEVNAWCKPRHRTVLWCWDLSKAARLAQAFTILPALGWDIAAWSIAPQGTWLVWRNGIRSLTMVELTAFFSTDWATMEANFRDVDPPPIDNDPAPVAAIRTCADVAWTTRRAVVAYLGWIEREDLGDWQLTGTGQGFSAFRHRFLTHKMLIHWDVDARAAERRAMWAGRTEAYWHGTIRGRRTDEWDLTQAYPRICQRDRLPVELVKMLGPDDDIWRYIDDPNYSTLVEGTVTTDVPVVPAQREGRILWPTGTFATTVWDPELRLLRDVGGSVRVSRAWVHRNAPALSEWAEWVTGKLNDDDPTVPAWQRVIARHWSRAVIGRLGMQHAIWEYVARMPRTGIKWWTQKDVDSGEVSDLVHVGRQLWETQGRVDWAYSIPAIPSWVASRAREMMTRLWLAMPAKTVLYMDTDSLLVEAKHARTVAAVAAQHPDWGLRLKRSWRRVTILGPRQIITGDRVRASGVPVRAALLADGSLAGEVRESLRGAIAAGRTDRVRVTPRRWHLREVDHRRAVGSDGWTQAHHLSG